LAKQRSEKIAACKMPHPPETMTVRQVPHERQSAQFATQTVDLTCMMNTLRQEVLAERSLAETRHQEILVKLQEQLLALHSSFEEHPKKVAEEVRRQAPGDKLYRAVEAFEDIECDVEEMENKEPESPLSQTEIWHHRSSKLHNEFEQVKGTSLRASLGIDQQDSRELELSGAAYVSHRIKKVVLQRSFELGTAALIFFNALVMCVEVQHDGLQISRKLKYGYDTSSQSPSDIWPGADTAFVFFDWSFGAVFIVEAVTKLIGFRFAYFFSVWNWIDFGCVLAFVVDKVATALNLKLLDAQTIRLMRLFRLVRLIRLIRTLEKLEMLYIMTTAIKGMRAVVMWAMALLVLILMTCALFLSVFVQSTYFDSIDLDTATPTELAMQREMYKYFGSFSRCMFSMFELTLANWPPVARLLTEEMSEWFGVICIFYKVTVGFAVVGVINGVVFQETFQVAHTDDVVMVRQKRRAKKALQQKMGALFQALDINHDGSLAFSEFMRIANQPEVRLWLESLDIETDDLLTLFLLIDADGDGTIDLHELLTHIPRLRGTARGIDMLAVRKRIPAFHLLQEDPGPEHGGNTFQWRETAGPSAHKLGAISEAKFSWGGDSAASSHKGLDEILQGA
jgi:hypothetical protein